MDHASEPSIAEDISRIGYIFENAIYLTDKEAKGLYQKEMKEK